MSHTYLSVGSFKGVGVANLLSDQYDARILQLLESQSRWLDNHCKRHFFPRIETRYFGGNGQKAVEFPEGEWDLISITTLREDDNGDGTYNVTWAAADYELGPWNNDPTREPDPKPYRIIEVNERDTGSQDLFIRGQKAYELVGEFGFCKLSEATGAVINEGADFAAADTTLTVDDGSLIDVGDTLLIGTEYLYVTGQDVAEANDFTVRRGVNGSTAALHSDATAISRLIYPDPVVEAVRMRATQLWTRRTSGYVDQIGFNESSSVMIPQTGMDPDVLRQLDEYRLFVTA